MEISQFVKSSIELSYFSSSNSWVLSEQSETFGVSIKRFEIGEVFIDSIHWFLFRSSNEKNGSISTLDGVFFGWWLIVWNRVSLFDITNREWRVQWFSYCFGSLSFISFGPLSFIRAGGGWSSLNDWFWSGNNWLWSRYDNFFNMLWFSKVFIIGSILGVFLILFFSELSSLNINKLYVVNSLSHSQVSWSGKHLG